MTTRCCSRNVVIPLVSVIPSGGKLLKVVVTSQEQVHSQGVLLDAS